jgi:anti-sigma regulatory factor (Ser/Thr protein kinase)/anti-anti-sigma regulatory factor
MVGDFAVPDFSAVQNEVLHGELRQASRTGKYGGQKCQLIAKYIDSMSYELRVASDESTFEFRAFVQLYGQLAPHIHEPEPKNVLIDLSHPHYFGPAGMVPLCGLISTLEKRGWIIDVLPPEAPLLRTYWESAGWLQSIEGTDLPQTTSRRTYIPIVHFSDHHILNDCVTSAMNVLSITSEYPTGVLNAVEWTLNEIADNVLVHSQSSGWLQVIARPNQHQIDFVVSDYGLSIPTTLREAYPQIAADSDLLKLAVQRGVTRDASVGQGNGLAGSMRIAEAIRGWVTVASGTSVLRHQNNGDVNLQSIPRLQGTTVALSIPTSHPINITDALWGYTPPSTFELSHVTQTGVLFRLSDEYSSYGNRASGADLALRLRNIMNENPGESVIIDFAGIDLTSASFLDEFLAKVIRREGVATFFNRVQLVQMTPFVERTLNEVVEQRLRSG